MSETKFIIVETESGANPPPVRARRIIVPDGSLQLSEADAADLTRLTVTPAGVFTFEQFGAVGDGVTDDTDAIQATFDAVEANGGGTILLGLKEYVVAGPLQDVLASSSQLVLPRVAPADPMISIHLQGVTPVNILTNDKVSQIRSTLNVEKSFTASAATNALTVTANPFINGQVVWVRNSGGALPGNLAPLTFYYVRDKDVEGANTFKLAATPSGSAIDLSSDGTGSNFIGPFGSLIGGRPVNGSGTSTQNEIAHNGMNWITFTANNVGFRTPENSTINGVDLRFIPTSRLDDCRIDVSGIDVTLSSGVVPDLAVDEPTRPTYGLLGPIAYVPNLCQINNLLILGYWTCVRWGELMNVGYMEMGACKVGIEMRQGTHASCAQKLLFVSTASIMEMKGVDPFFGGVADASIYNPIDIQQFDWENATGAGSMAWTTTTSIISDPNNQLYGDIRWASAFSMVKTGGVNLRLHQTNKPYHLYRPFTNVTGSDLDSSDHAVAEIYRGLSTSDASKLAWLLLTSKQTGTAHPLGILAFCNDQIADGNNKILAQIAGITDGATNSGRLNFYTTDSSGTQQIRAAWDKYGNFIQVGMALFGEGGSLSISSNTIAPTFRYHRVDAGLIKTITVPPGPGTSVAHEFWILPTAAFTWDTTGNIATAAGTAIVAVPILAQWWPASSKWTLTNINQLRIAGSLSLDEAKMIRFHNPTDLARASYIRHEIDTGTLSGHALIVKVEPISGQDSSTEIQSLAPSGQAAEIHIRTFINSVERTGLLVDNDGVTINTTQGALYVPNMTTTQKNALTPTRNGAIIYDETTDKFCGYANGAWVDLH